MIIFKDMLQNWVTAFKSKLCLHNSLTMRARNNAGMKDWLDRLRILEESFRT